jgi:predicted TIM-barrel fold metal-dependent hydrolase
MIIDFSAHVIPPGLKGIFAVSGDIRFNHSPNTPKDRLALMDRYGIDAQVVHLSAAQLSGLSSEGSVKACRAVNDYIHEELTSKYPDRFIGCGAVSLLDADAALEELDRIKGMGFKCATVPAHQGDRGLDHPESRSVLRRAAELGLPVFIHPIDLDGLPLVDKVAMGGFGWPFDTSVAVWRLMVGGVFDELPNLRVVLHHMGAMLPFFRHRINMRFKKHLNSDRTLEQYVPQMYVDTAVDGESVVDLMAAYSLFGSKRIMFGSDWPYVDDSASIRDNLAAIRAAPIPDEEKEMILHGNVEELLGLKRS